MATIYVLPVLHVWVNDKEFNWICEAFQTWLGEDLKGETFMLVGNDDWDEFLRVIDEDDVPKFAETVNEELQQYRYDRLNMPEDILFIR